MPIRLSDEEDTTHPGGPRASGLIFVPGTLSHLHDSEAVTTNALFLEARTAAVNASLLYDEGVRPMVTYNIVVPTVESLDPSSLEEPLGLVEHLVEGHGEH